MRNVTRGGEAEFAAAGAAGPALTGPTFRFASRAGLLVSERQP